MDISFFNSCKYGRVSRNEGDTVPPSSRPCERIFSALIYPFGERMVTEGKNDWPLNIFGLKPENNYGN